MSFEMFVYIFGMRILEAFFFSSFPLSQRLNAWLTHITDIMLIFLHLIICCLDASVVARRHFCCRQRQIPRLNPQSYSEEPSLSIPCLKSFFCLCVFPSLPPMWVEEKRVVVLSRFDHCTIFKTKTSNSRSKACASSSITLFASYQNKNRRFRHYAED